MRKSCWVLALLAIFAFALPVKAQDETPKAELYVGYDYVRVNAIGTSFNFNGGSGQLAYNANQWLGIVGDLGGYYTNNGFRAGVISYQFGPGREPRKAAKSKFMWHAVAITAGVTAWALHEVFESPDRP